MLKPLVLLLYSNLFVLVLFDGLSHNVLANHVQDTGIGPCFIRRTRLPRLDGIKVGHVQHIQLTSSGNAHLVRTLSLNPPIFEIPDFLSDDECSHLIKIAASHVMESSDIYQSDDTLGNHDYHTSFSDWDRNGDRLIDRNEIYLSLLYLKDIHFTDDDISMMFEKLNIGRVKEGFIHSREFKVPKIMKYIDKVVANDTSVKGRHSNNTWLDTWEDDVMTSLNMRKAALTGLPLEAIQASESPTVIRYGTGGHYHCHYDSHRHDNTQPCCGRLSVDNCRVCRYITIMYYLSDVNQGGQTAFPFANTPTKETRPSTHNVSNLSSYCYKANLLVTPNRGKAVMWYNHVINEKGMVGRLDLASYHGGCDVKQGQKWIMNNWINVLGDDIKTWNDRNERLATS